MGRSVFVKNTRNDAGIRCQMRRVNEVMGSEALAVEGPCADRKGVLEALKSEVHRARTFGSSSRLPRAAVDTLFPRNLQEEGRSILKIPFMYGQRQYNDSDRGTAGDVAFSKPVKYNGCDVRFADLDETMLLIFSVMRRMGTKCYFAYIHHDRGSERDHLAELLARILPVSVMSSLPSILLPGDRPQVISSSPPGPFGLSYLSPASTVEVLDSDAVHALFTMKLALGKAVELMGGIAGDRVEYRAAGASIAAEIGHLLHDALNSWTMDEAQRDIGYAASMLGKDASIFTSVRTIAERQYFHTLACPHGQAQLAARKMLVGKIPPEMISSIVGLFADEDPETQFRLLEPLKGNAAVIRFTDYLRLAARINQHLHHPDTCTPATPTPSQC